MRKLTAILFSDIVGFSGKMSKNESETLKILKLNTGLHQRIIKQFGGTIIKAMGDGYLCTFTSSYDAVLAGDQLIREVAKIGSFELRVGIHVGDVVHDGGTLSKGKDVYGDGVNIAARIESNAPAPGVWVSDRVAGDLENHEFIQLESAGMFELKNIPKPMEIFAVHVDENHESIKAKVSVEPSSLSFQKKVIAPVLTAIVILIAWVTWQQWQDHNAPDSIAILPFEYASPDDAYRYLSTSFPDDLASSLTSEKTLKVLSRSTSKKLGQTTELLSELEVDYIVEGSIQFTNAMLKIQLQLVTADSDEILWSKISTGQADMIPALIDTSVTEILNNLTN